MATVSKQIICLFSQLAISPVTARLANGDGMAGRLEIFYRGEWSTVCGDGFRDKEARVACKMLGFNRFVLP